MLEYDNETHSYKIDGKAVKSVTELAKEFSGLDTAWLDQNPQYKEFGTMVHEELSARINGQDVDMDERTRKIVARFEENYGKIENMAENGWQSERLVFNKNRMYAGTLDLIRIKNKVCTDIVDFKSGTTENRDYFTCQLNLYRLALESMGVDCSSANLIIVNPKKILRIEKLDWDSLVNISEHDYLKLTRETGEEINEIEERMREIEKYVLEYNELKSRLAETVLENMRASGKKKYDTWMYKYSYVPGTVRRTLDKDKVKELIGDQIESCYTETTVKETVKLIKMEK